MLFSSNMNETFDMLAASRPSILPLNWFSSALCLRDTAPHVNH